MVAAKRGEVAVTTDGDAVDRPATVPAPSLEGLRTLRSKSLIVDLYPALIQDLGGWISIADLVELMGSLGVDEQVVRSTVSRFARKGLLERRKVDGKIGYQLTGASARNIEVNEQRVFSPLVRARAEDGWVLCSFSVPESIRAARHQLRSALGWLGFGNLTDGLWVAPSRVLPNARSTVEWLGLQEHVDLFEARYRAFGEPHTLVERCWDLEDMRQAYVGFLEVFDPVLSRHEDGESEPEEAFVDYLRAVAEWRRLPYDPGIPLELLPPAWEGARAAEVFSSLQSRLEPVAKRHVIRVVSR